MLGKLAEELQEDVEVTSNSISGTLHYVTGYTGFSSDPEMQSGNYLALKFTDLDPKATSIKVGLDPSYSGGLVEILTDPDKNCVFKIHDNTQKFVVEVTTPEEVERFEYDLTDLVLEES